MRQEKQLLLDEIKAKIDGSNAIVVTRYQNFTPNLASQFRSQLLQAGGDFEVVRKRIFLKAAESSGIQFNPETLEGHIGIVFSEKDPVGVIKTLIQFSKDNEEIFSILGGRFDGNLCSARDVVEISKLPSKEEMRSQFLALLEAPLSQTLSTMESLLTSVMYCLENKSQNNS